MGGSRTRRCLVGGRHRALVNGGGVRAAAPIRCHPAQHTVRGPSGSNFVVTRDATNGVLFARRNTDAPVRGVTSWAPFGGNLQGDPQAANVPNGVLVFGRDASNQVVTNLFRNDGGQSGFTGVPGLLVSSEVEVVELDGAGGELVRIFARGLDDGAVYTNLLTTGGWTGWRNLGGFTTSEISAALTAGSGNTYRVVVRDGDNRVSTTVLSSDGSTTGWTGIGGPAVRGNIRSVRRKPLRRRAERDLPSGRDHAGVATRSTGGWCAGHAAQYYEKRPLRPMVAEGPVATSGLLESA